MANEDLKYWESIIKGDETAYAKLYEQYFKLLYNYGRKICTDKSRVEDAIHDLFVDLWRYRKNLSITTSVRFYLYRSLRRRLVKSDSKVIWANSDENFAMEDALHLITQSKEHDIIETEIHDQQVHRLKKLLNDLSPRQYEALVLYFYDDFSYDDIATLMDLNPQSVRNLVQRGLMQMRQYIKHIISIFLFILPGI